MPLTVSRQACLICGSEYTNFNDAFLCEQLSVPPNPYPAGSWLSFECESDLGSLWSYTQKGGNVLGSYISRSGDSHIRVWVVQVSEPDRTVEYEVIYSDDGMLVSPKGMSRVYGFFEQAKLQAHSMGFYNWGMM